MTRKPVDVLVCNPGTHPEMTYVAAATAGHYATIYATSSSITEDMALAKALKASQRIIPSISTTGLRRLLPDEIHRSNIKYAGAGLEILYQLSKRMAPKYADGLLRRRTASYGRKIGRVVSRYRPKLIIGQYTASLRAFQSAEADSIKVLNYPIVHHRWLRDHMRREAELNPKWAATLQGHDFSDEVLATLDEEIRLADHLLVPSSFAASTFVESGVPRSKLHVIPLGCERLQTTRHQASHHDERTGTLKLIYAGQVTQRKGVGYLAEALHTVPNARLTIVGESTIAARSLLEEYPRIELVPSMPRSALLDRMRDADVLVLPSLAEGFGLVALEAMSVGCIALVSNATFAADIIEDGVNGFLLPDVSAQSITAQLIRISRHPDLNLIRTNAERTAQSYSWSSYRGAVTDLVSSLLQENEQT